MKTKLSIQKGKNLSIQTIKQLNKIWLKVWPKMKPLALNRKSFVNHTFFILRDSRRKILSIGRLQPIKVNFYKKFYNIQGIADIVSVIRKKGYGRILVRAMYEHLSRRKQSGVGFCERKNSTFYQKCGFKVIRNIIGRFVYKTPKGKLIKDKGDDDVLYVDGNNNFMKKVLAHPKEKVLLPHPHW